MNYWEATGKQVIANGEGIYSYTKHIVGPTPGYDLHFICQYKDGKPNGEQTGYYPNGKLFCKEQFSKGDLVQGESYDGFDTKYTYNKLEEYPQFPGGDTALIRFLQKNITYPEGDRDNDIQGNVLIRFVVDRGGGVRNVTVARGVTKGLNNEAVRVVKMLPNFKPGRIRGQAVDVYYNLPVVFRLQ